MYADVCNSDDVIVEAAIVPLALLITTIKVDTANSSYTANEDCSRMRRGGDSDAAADCEAHRARRGGDADTGYTEVQSGQTVFVFLVALLGVLFISWVVDLISSPNAETLKELKDFHRAQEMMIATIKGEQPTQQNTVGHLDATAENEFRLAAEQSTHKGLRAGGKILRFSDKNMAAAIRKNKEEKGKVGSKSLFFSYQKILDERDPNNKMSTENVKRRQAWQKSGGLAAMMNRGGKGKAGQSISMDRLGLALTKRGSIKGQGSIDTVDESSDGAAAAAFITNKKGKRPSKVQVAPAPQQKGSASSIARSSVV